MSDGIGDMAKKFRDALASVAPKGTGFVLLYILPDEEDFGIIGNMKDDISIALMEDAIDSMGGDAEPID